MVNDAGEGQRIRKAFQALAVICGGIVGSAQAAGFECAPFDAKQAAQTVVVRTAVRVVTARDCPLLEFALAGADGRVEFVCPVERVSEMPGTGAPVGGGTTTVAVTPMAYWTQCQVTSIARRSCGPAGIVEQVNIDCADENPPVKR